MADEKQEKSEEKEREKNQEKTEEKTWEEKWQRDPLTAITWACIFIWAGIVFLLSNLGVLDSLLHQVERLSPISGIQSIDKAIQAWPIVLAGAGVILLIQVAIRLLMPAYRKPVVGTVILALILISIGLGDLINWAIVWAMLLIILGVWILWRGIRSSRRNNT
jgi:hypothetical protein